MICSGLELGGGIESVGNPACGSQSVDGFNTSDFTSGDIEVEKGPDGLDNELPTFSEASPEGYSLGDYDLPDFSDDLGDEFNEISDCDLPIFKDGSELPAFYVDADGVSKNLPRSDGTWTGEPGNSSWKPDADYVPQKANPDGKTWKEILDKYDIEGIDFNDGEPDFSEVSVADVQIDEIGEERDENFAKADEVLAEKWTAEQKDGHDWSASDVRDYRKDEHLTWHECGDRTTLQLVPAEVHSNIPHSGGVSAAKGESLKNGNSEMNSKN